MDIPDLLDVIQRWDQRVRSHASDSLWYATLSDWSLSLTETKHAIKGRSCVISDDIRSLCFHAGVPYLSPHKFRHGHIVYAMRQARNMEELKAISQNVMHSSVTITDAVYGNLITNDVQDIIANLGTKKQDPDKAEILRLINLLQAQL